ncbi:D-alanyl-lipoteichoic acid acyltransferase DltB, MBOAT superfamily [Hymenobacter daecheongensis DSM 21074]|uniref:D-alanyl-lipoteichoic acid acyltransferase DltB, MBOAT superfamily n=1 Tax=Hymenobacter daecheongensis DSM 21074 TaxID=1121955 RepID=A0A1M6JST4_9BACT|nr:MBOAT family O-acyltransferase [Hymenobacter daecheongensis]SHJ49731.1 D-alanyl-lipoteichoic acid acyltransferase DltB, MBOAT superfamily [Hymenobacter daecheongensis DSM 21074]
MLFNSFEFLVLVLVTLALYYLPLLRRWQVPILIGSSLFFYAWTNPWLLLLFLLSAFVNVATSYQVVHAAPERRFFYAALGVVSNLGILAFFKYSPLIGHSLFPDTSEAGRFLSQIPLPIGISFYTFEGISLLVDAYRERDRHAAQELVPKSIGQHVRNTTLFVAFFPHLIAGPILKAHQFIPQIKPKYLTDIDWEAFFRAVVVGYFLKIVVADNLKEQTFWIAYPYFERQSSLMLITMLFGYSMQIFADFAGYSLIAIGVAHLFGYSLPDNFNFPYISQSITEFWRRWHISLSSFLREYLYIPLGGNRKGETRTYLNLMVVMFLGGLWHGAAWSYAVWGSFHGIALAVERLSGQANRVPRTVLGRVAATLFTFGLVSLAWLLFRLPNFEQALSYLYHMGSNRSFAISGLEYLTIACILIYSLPVVLYHVWYLAQESAVGFGLQRLSYAWYGLMLFLTLTNAGPAGSFIYFQF